MYVLEKKEQSKSEWQMYQTETVLPRLVPDQPPNAAIMGKLYSPEPNLNGKPPAYCADALPTELPMLPDMRPNTFLPS